MKTKATMLSEKNSTYLFDHILDGFKSSFKGLVQLKETKLVSDQEYAELMAKNAQRLIDRVHEFKIAQKLVSVFFAALFLWMQVTDQDLEMRRSKRMRVRRRNEKEAVLLD